MDIDISKVLDEKEVKQLMNELVIAIMKSSSKIKRVDISISSSGDDKEFASYNINP